MSRRRKPQGPRGAGRQPAAQPAPDDDDRGFSVCSDVAPDGSPTYIVTVSYDKDVALSLRADAAVRFATTLIRAATIAEHDAALLAQMSTMGIPEAHIAPTIADLRADREPVNDAATAPFRFEPIVSHRNRKPYLSAYANGEHVGQLEPQDAREIAMHVLEVLAGVDLDAAYYRYLVHTIGTEEPVARAAVHDLQNHR